MYRRRSPGENHPDPEDLAPERSRRVLAMVRAMDQPGFGNCGNERECEAVCPGGD